MAVDITDPQSITEWHDQVIEKFGRLDGLVNRALARVGGGFETQAADDWMHSARGDMVGLYIMCKSFLADMIRQRRGSIINISSIYGVVGLDPSLYVGTTIRQPPPPTSFRLAGPSPRA